MTVILLLSAGMSAGNHNCFSVKIHDDVFFEDRETFSVVLDSLETESGEAVPDLMSVLRQRTEVIITDDESELYCHRQCMYHIQQQLKEKSLFTGT